MKKLMGGLKLSMLMVFLIVGGMSVFSVLDEPSGVEKWIMNIYKNGAADIAGYIFPGKGEQHFTVEYSGLCVDDNHSIIPFNMENISFAFDDLTQHLLMQYGNNISKRVMSSMPKPSTLIPAGRGLTGFVEVSRKWVFQRAR